MGASYPKPEFPPLLERGFHIWTMPQVRAGLVKAFATSLTRRGIMDGLDRFVARLDDAGITGELWLDGSFLTEKIDPEDVDCLIRVSSDLYDGDSAKRAVIDWASEVDRRETHSCDADKWVEYIEGHPLFGRSDSDREFWTEWFGKSRGGVPKGIVVVVLPTVMK
jgi:hypothetical protein